MRIFSYLGERKGPNGLKGVSSTFSLNSLIWIELQIRPVLSPAHKLTHAIRFIHFFFYQ